MKGNRLKWGVLAIILASTQLSVAQEILPKKVLIKKEMSLSSQDNKIVRATQSITFESGFKAKEGCNFFAAVVDEMVEQIPQQSAFEFSGDKLVDSFEFEAYPTITLDKVNLKISGTKDPQITIYNEESGKMVFRSFDETIQEVSLAPNGRGTYIIKVSSGEETLLKRVIVQ